MRRQCREQVQVEPAINFVPVTLFLFSGREGAGVDVGEAPSLLSATLGSFTALRTHGRTELRTLRQASRCKI